ncbi:MAG: DUF1998 domain-containing protein [Geminicoccaceae bacterium]|nr:DUF1998 domain-containing protein [Geminicoccaceae bacterium]
MSKNLLRLSQLVTTFGPGAMLDLPDRSVMIAGLDRWDDAKRRRIVEPRLERKLPDGPQRGLATAPLHEESPYRRDAPGVDAIVFPQWFVASRGEAVNGRVRRRLVRFGELDQRSKCLVEEPAGKKVKIPVAPVRFVAACEHGHVEDIDWSRFVHRGSRNCAGRLELEESAATGDVAETWIRCACGQSRALYEALGPDNKVLGRCGGARPWLGRDAREACDRHLRLLVRTASNAYFPVALTVLALPTETEEDRLDRLVAEHREDLEPVKTTEDLAQAFRFNKRLAQALSGFTSEAVLAALARARGEGSPRPRLKPEELAVLAGPALGERSDPEAVLVSEHLPRERWDPDRRFPVVARLTLVHRLRVVTALRGFTRFDFANPDRDGELDPEVRVQELSLDPKPYPATEQHGEGLFLLFERDAVKRWKERPEVLAREQALEAGFRRWAEARGREPKGFPGATWIALHTLSHMLLAEIALEAGYPLASLKERVYVGEAGCGILLYAAAFDLGGTLGGLLALGPRLCELLERARERNAICSADPTCAEHDPRRDRSGNPLAGAACHGCVLLPEPCCEVRNDFLDRALAIGTIVDPRLGLLG